jgi:hypothetical protein
MSHAGVWGTYSRSFRSVSAMEKQAPKAPVLAPSMCQPPNVLGFSIVRAALTDLTIVAATEEVAALSVVLVAPMSDN